MSTSKTQQQGWKLQDLVNAYRVLRNNSDNATIVFDGLPYQVVDMKVTLGDLELIVTDGQSEHVVVLKLGKEAK